MGEAVYEIGIEDDGSPKGLSDSEMAFVCPSFSLFPLHYPFEPTTLSQSLQVLDTMAGQLGASTKILRIRDGKEG